MVNTLDTDSSTVTGYSLVQAADKSHCKHSYWLLSGTSSRQVTLQTQLLITLWYKQQTSHIGNTVTDYSLVQAADIKSHWKHSYWLLSGTSSRH